ncbi:peptide ABC transporter substrate-binding protein [Candidatus Villigracilis saccharophilus]|uniref:peptide ABC transporter substrate-binding protein n=1 Tax=Candidatus Villigracilis saccharophilus TaxID=3140684 RepID=UPI0031370AA1|nr:peptide ABC transporter substrate-binding protein [Anaerolineales bacterium]
MRRRNMRKIFALLSLVVVLSMALAACGGGAPAATEAPATGAEQPAATEAPAAATEAPAPGAVRENVLRVNTGTYPDIIDPQKSSFVNEIAHLNKVYMGLTTLNEKLETIPGAAESFTFNDDATELVFVLKPGLLYSDGSVLNAKRFEFAFQRNIDPATAGEYASITDEIVGAPEWRAADTTAADYDPEVFIAALGVKASHADGAECVDYEDTECNTLTMNFSKPAPYFATIAGIWVGYPAKEENIAEGGDIWWTSSKYQVGNGPFVWQSVEPFVKSVFVPNANFVGAGIPTYTLEFSYITDSAVAFEAYKNGEFDVVGSAAEDLPVIDADADLTAQHVKYAGSCTTKIQFSLHPTWNGQPNPLADPKVREAFAYAYNAEGWVTDVDGGLGSATWSWIPPGYPGYDAASPLKFDVEAAKAALAAAGEEFNSAEKLNAMGLKMTYAASARNQQRHEWLAANYKETLGVDLALDPVEPTTFTALQKDPDTYPLFSRGGWCADYPDPQNWLSVYWRSDTTFANRFGYNNPAFDELVNKGDVETDPTARMEYYAQAQQILLADIPAAFGYNSLNHYLVKPWVTGFNTTPQDGTYPGDVTPWTITIDTMMP